MAFPSVPIKVPPEIELATDTPLLSDRSPFAFVTAYEKCTFVASDSSIFTNVAFLLTPPIVNSIEGVPVDEAISLSKVTMM